jgi:hypothetical protein
MRNRVFHQKFIVTTNPVLYRPNCDEAILHSVHKKGETDMVRKIGIAAAAALVALFAANDASFAASKSKKSSQENSFRDVTKCEGGACTNQNPDRVPNQSAQFYRSSHKKKKTHKSN